MKKLLLLGCLVLFSCKPAFANEDGEKKINDLLRCLTVAISRSPLINDPSLALNLMRYECRPEYHAWLEGCKNSGQEDKYEGICGAEAIMMTMAAVAAYGH